MTDRTILSTEQVAELLGVHPETVRRWVRSGVGPPVAGRVGLGARARYRFRRAVVLSWLAGDPKGGDVGSSAEELSRSA